MAVPHDTSLSSRLPKKADRALIISPFLRAQFVASLADSVTQLIVVSTQTELDALSDDVYGRLDPTSVFVVTGNDCEDVPSLDLHAKLLLWESGDQRETMLGSANATGPAWGLGGRANCEAVVALRPGLRINDTCRAFIEPKNGVLHGWIELYRRSKLEITDEDRARLRLDALQRIASKIEIIGKHDAAKEILSLRSSTPPPAELTDRTQGLKIEIAPLLRCSQESNWQPLSEVFSSGARFSNISPSELSAFALVQLKDTSHSISRRFVLQFLLSIDSKTADARDDAIHARLLEGLDPQTMLLNILKGTPAGSGAVLNRSGGNNHQFEGSFLKKATVERVIEACTSDSSKIEEIDALLSVYRSSSGLESFRQFWSEFKTALQEASRV